MGSIVKRPRPQSVSLSLKLAPLGESRRPFRRVPSISEPVPSASRKKELNGVGEGLDTVEEDMLIDVDGVIVELELITDEPSEGLVEVPGMMVKIAGLELAEVKDGTKERSEDGVKEGAEGAEEVVVEDKISEERVMGTEIDGAPVIALVDASTEVLGGNSELPRVNVTDRIELVPRARADDAEKRSDKLEDNDGKFDADSDRLVPEGAKRVLEVTELPNGEIVVAIEIDVGARVALVDQLMSVVPMDRMLADC